MPIDAKCLGDRIRRLAFRGTLRDLLAQLYAEFRSAALRLVMVQVASAPVHDERGDFTRIGKDHVGTIAHHASSDQSGRVLFGTVGTCVRL